MISNDLLPSPARFHRQRQKGVELGPNGKRAWFWQDGSWQVGRAFEIMPDGSVLGMCRDYGTWGCALKPRDPLQTHGTWRSWEVAWAKPADQFAKPQPNLLDPGQ